MISTDKTILLAHAAWADGSSWNKVIVRLHTQGFRVVSAQLPLTSLMDDAAAIKRELALLNAPVILVGHSYGGAVITAAASGQDKVKALVIVAGMAPDSGETVAALLHRDPPHPEGVTPVPDEFGFLRLPEGAFAKSASPDSTPAETSLMQAVQRPLALACMTEPMSQPSWRHLRSWFLVAQNDRMIPAVTQEFMAQRMGASIRRLPVDHNPLSSAPDVVVSLINEAALACERDSISLDAQA